MFWLPYTSLELEEIKKRNDIQNHSQEITQFKVMIIMVAFRKGKHYIALYFIKDNDIFINST